MIVQADEGEINFVDFASSPGKMHTFYHAVARHFDIPRADYVDLLPEIPEPSAAAIPLQPPYASPKNAANAQDVLPLAAY